MDAPPVLTPERIDAMLSIMAEVCLEAVVEAGQRQKTADDPEAFERSGRTLQRACRNLRQTIAMKQRHDREQDRKAEDGRRLVVAEREDAERGRRDAVARKRAAVRAHFDRVLWDEYEQDEALRLFDEVEDRLGDLAHDPDFLETSTPALIRRLADEIAETAKAAEADAADHPPPPPPPASSTRTGCEDGAERAEPAESSAPSAISAVEADGAAAEGLIGEPPAAEPPPPDPPPEPYIPPWERLRPGQIMPGGSGW